MLKVMAINGSPRKDWNTAKLLESALAGVQSVASAETEIVHLYQYKYSGCRSCYQCKRLGNHTTGKCALHDEITPALERAAEADILLLGTPIYFWDVTGEMQCFIERLLFPYNVYEFPPTSLWKKKTVAGLFFSMNMSRERCEQSLILSNVERMKIMLQRILGTEPEYTLAHETMEVSDYSKYYMPRFDQQIKMKRREEVFPKELQEAYEVGVKLAKQLIEQ